jgi:hypothetical protein
LEPNKAQDEFTVWYLSPVLRNGLVVLGETDKWVPVSKGRLEWMTVWEDAVAVGLMGGAEEKVNWSWAMQMDGEWVVQGTTCALGPEGKATLIIGVDGKSQCSQV